MKKFLKYLLYLGLLSVLGLLVYGLIKNIMGPDPCRCLALQYENPNVYSELSSRIRSNPNQTYDELKDDMKELQEKQENSWALSKSCSDFYFKKANLTYGNFSKEKYIAYLSGLCNSQKVPQYDSTEEPEEGPEVTNVPDEEIKKIIEGIQNRNSVKTVSEDEVLTDNIDEDEVMPEEIEIKRTSTNKFVGTYSFSNNECENGCGSLLINPESDNSLIFYLEVNRGAPNYNSGSLMGKLFISNQNTYEYTSNEFGSCGLTFKLDDNFISIKTIDNRNDCGFGNNVSADGVYKLLNNYIPEYYINGEGSKIFF